MLQDLTTDVLIIGAGPAGLAAAIYTARSGKKTIVLKGKARSRLELAHLIENYPGSDPIKGADLLKRFEAQALKFGAEIVSGDALELGLTSDPKMVTTRTMFINAKSIILALGKGEPKKSVANEMDFLGAGVSYCATCDGPFFKGKKVVVYGNDHEAVEEAQALQDLGCKTTLVLYCGSTACPANLLQQAQSKGITVIADTEITEVNGQGIVQSITLKNSTGEKIVETDALFIMQAVPALTLLNKAGLELTNKDCLAVDRTMATNIPGVYAAGDLTCGGLQVSVAVGEGVTAALQALKYLR